MLQADLAFLHTHKLQSLLSRRELQALKWGLVALQSPRASRINQLHDAVPLTWQIASPAQCRHCGTAKVDLALSLNLRRAGSSMSSAAMLALRNATLSSMHDHCSIQSACFQTYRRSPLLHELLSLVGRIPLIHFHALARQASGTASSKGQIVNRRDKRWRYMTCMFMAINSKSKGLEPKIRGRISSGV